MVEKLEDRKLVVESDCSFFTVLGINVAPENISNFLLSPASLVIG